MKQFMGSNGLFNKGGDNNLSAVSEGSTRAGVGKFTASHSAKQTFFNCNPHEKPEEKPEGGVPQVEGRGGEEEREWGWNLTRDGDLSILRTNRAMSPLFANTVRVIIYIGNVLLI